MIPAPGRTGPIALAALAVILACADARAAPPDQPRLVAQVGHADGCGAVAYSPDSKLVVTGGSDGRLILWDAATGREVRRLEGHGDAVTAVAFSPDGRLVVTSGWDRSVRLWDVATGRQIRTFSGHPTLVNDVGFSPDGRRIISAGALPRLEARRSSMRR